MGYEPAQRRLEDTDLEGLSDEISERRIRNVRVPIGSEGRLSLDRSYGNGDVKFDLYCPISQDQLGDLCEEGPSFLTNRPIKLLGEKLTLFLDRDFYFHGSVHTYSLCIKPHYGSGEASAFSISMVLPEDIARCSRAVSGHSYRLADKGENRDLREAVTSIATDVSRIGAMVWPREVNEEGMNAFIFEPNRVTEEKLQEILMTSLTGKPGDSHVRFDFGYKNQKGPMIEWSLGFNPEEIEGGGFFDSRYTEKFTYPIRRMLEMAGVEMEPITEVELEEYKTPFAREVMGTVWDFTSYVLTAPFRPVGEWVNGLKKKRLEEQRRVLSYFQEQNVPPSVESGDTVVIILDPNKEKEIRKERD